MRSVHSGARALGPHQPIYAMTAANRITQTTGTKAKKTSKQLASCTSASSHLKRLVPVSSTKSMKGSSAKSPPTSSSDSECGRRSLLGGNATFNRKGTKDALEDATFSTSECSSETTSTEFEASNEIFLKYIEPDETKCITTVAEPDPGPHIKDLDVLNSNLAVNWFSLSDNDFDGFLKTNTDQNPDNAGLEKQISLSCEVKAVDSPDSIPEDTNNGRTDEFQGADCREYSNTTSPQDKKSEDEKNVEEELRIIKTPDVQECSKGENNFHQCEDEQASLETSEGTSEANAQERTQQAKASRNLLCLEGYLIDAFRGSKVLLSSLFVLFTIWLSVRKLTDDEMAPPPT